MINFNKIWMKLMEAGSIAGCHQMAERSFFFRGYQFPLCARCTGIFLGHIIGFVLYLAGLWIPFSILLLMWVPCAVDGLVQKYTKYVSNNLKRIVTGVLVGISYVYILFSLLFILLENISI